MISKTELEQRAQAKLKDAEVLLENNRLDSAVYLSGYVMELTLKAKICETLDWSGFPETRAEFQNFASLKTHNLDTLLSFSGLGNKIKTAQFADWSKINEWKPEMRYREVGVLEVSEAKAIIDAIKKLKDIIL